MAFSATVTYYPPYHTPVFIPSVANPLPRCPVSPLHTSGHPVLYFPTFIEAGSLLEFPDLALRIPCCVLACPEVFLLLCYLYDFSWTSLFVELSPSFSPLRLSTPTAHSSVAFFSISRTYPPSSLIPLAHNAISLVAIALVLYLSRVPGMMMKLLNTFHFASPLSGFRPMRSHPLISLLFT